MYNLRSAQEPTTQCIEQGSTTQLEASKSSKSTMTEPQKQSGTINMRCPSSTSMSDCSTSTVVVQASKKIKSTDTRTPEKEKITHNPPNMEESEVFTPWYLLASDPLADFEIHTSVTYSMIDKNPLLLPMGDYQDDDNSTDDDEDDEDENKQINAQIK